MDVDDRIADVRHVVVQVPDQLAELDRHGVAHGVRDVHRRRAGIDHGLADLGQELRLRPRSVFRTELDVLAELLRVIHAPDGLLDDLVLGFLQLELPMDRRRGQEYVDPRPVPGRRDGVGTTLDVLGDAPCQPGDPRPLDRPGDRLHRLEVARRSDREARLDNVHVQPRQLSCDLHFFLQAHAGARTLLAVSQRRVEDDHPVLLVTFLHFHNLHLVIH